MSTQRFCAFPKCKKALPEDAHHSRLYCSESCGKKMYKLQRYRREQRKRKAPLGGRHCHDCGVPTKGAYRCDACWRKLRGFAPGERGCFGYEEAAF